MKLRDLVLGAAAVLALTSGCGGQAESGPAPPAAGANAAPSGQDLDLDKVDACVLLNDDELRAIFDEPGGKKSPTNTGSIKGCAFDDASGGSYVQVSVQLVPTGDKQQFDFDRSQAKAPLSITGVGDEAFGWYTDEGVEVETRYRGAVVTVALELYPSSDSDKLDDPAAVLDKLTTLTRQALARL
jgi:hypothetical protein